MSAKPHLWATLGALILLSALLLAGHLAADSLMREYARRPPFALCANLSTPV